MRGENFIYFLSVSGFFLGIIFGILKELDIKAFLYSIFLLTALFYIVGLGVVTFFIKYLDIKKIIYLDKKEIDSILDIQIKELEKKEDFIYESYEFIKKIKNDRI